MQREQVVCVVDDDAAVLKSLRWLLESVSLTVRTFGSAGEFLAAFEGLAGNPGLCVITDVRMPGMSGLELHDEIRRRGSGIPVIVITGHADVPMAVRALKSGVADFVEKPFNDQELLEKVGRVMAEHGRTREHEARRRVASARVAKLTAREREVFDLIVKGSANKQVAAALDLSEKTVETHRANVMRKMEVESLAELVRLSVLIEEAAAGGAPRAA